ncbi:MAG: polysaccharide biosynthesis protein [Anaerolineae bacterium]|nr:polysaccharide biosynthesis protein [Anaerolineae bacterium]NUQ06415.1 polysaccharide biosynthesis protein [Anaerolineae bacterium]
MNLMDFLRGRAHRRAVDVGLALLADVAIVIAAYLAAIALLTFSDRDYLRFGGSAAFIAYIAAAAFAQPAVLVAFGAYQRIWQRTSGYGVTILINAVAVATLIYIACLLIVPDVGRPFQMVLLGNMFSLIGFVAVRYRSRLLRSFGLGGSPRFRRKMLEAPLRVLIVGAGESGQTLAWRLKHRFDQSDTRYEIIGFIDDDAAKRGLFVEGCRVLGARDDLIRVAEERHADLIVVAIHRIGGADFRDILTRCEKTKALIKVVPDLQELVTSNQSAEFLRDVQPDDLIGRETVTRHEGIDLEPVTGKIVLITGAAGSIGSELSRQIIDYAPTRIILLDNNESGLHDLTLDLRTSHPHLPLVTVLADVTRRDSLRAVFLEHNPEVVFHAAAYKHVPLLQFYPSEAVIVNVFGSRNVAELAQEFGAQRFVLVSTDKAVNPSSVMGASKRLCELMLHALAQRPENRTRFAAVRFGNVLGSRGSVVPIFSRQIDEGGPVTVTHREMTRYFMSIPEAVNLIIHAACMTSGDDIFVLQMGEVVRIVELAERMIRLRGLRPYKDIAIHFTGIRPGEKMHEELFGHQENPGPTPHPSILKVGRWDVALQPAAFWMQIDQLVKAPPLSSEAALTEMRTILAGHRPAASGDQPDVA